MSTTLSYRITGPHSIDRLEQLLATLNPNVSWEPADLNSLPNRMIDFVWETNCEKEWRKAHDNAVVLNRLHNSIIIENKANLAFLQLRMKCNTLKTFICNSRSDLWKFAKSKWEVSTVFNIDVPVGVVNVPSTLDWWVVKASQGNGGRDIWILNQNNYKEVLSDLDSDEEYVIQQYVGRPMLWKGKKYHYRCYGLLMSDNSAYLYDTAYILTAGEEYSASDDKINRHVTNLSINKRYAGHPGQVPVNLKQTNPTVFERISLIYSEVCRVAGDFMIEQRSAHHFDFFGIDIIVDEDEIPWLIELNRLPGLESSKNNFDEENIMYDTMMTQLMQLVLKPLWNQFDPENSVEFEEEACRYPWMWTLIKEKRPSTSSFVPSSTLWKNLFSWKAFTRKQRRMILLNTETSSQVIAESIQESVCDSN